MGDRRLREVEERHELAHADLAGVLSQYVDELHADGIAERLGDDGHPLGVRPLDVGVDDGLATGLACRALLLRRQFQIDGHLFMNINSIEKCQCNILNVMADRRPEVLFVCVHNAGRSQMGAGLVDKLSGGRVHVRSAGSEPADRLNPGVVEAMAEVGVNLAKEYPKPLTDEAVRAADVVITMGCGDACPIYPGKRYEDWELEDPAGKDLETVRRIRDEITDRVQGLLADLKPERGAA
jgi:arsenate reductase (thioredoxin)